MSVDYYLVSHESRSYVYVGYSWGAGLMEPTTDRKAVADWLSEHAGKDVFVDINLAFFGEYRDAAKRELRDARPDTGIVEFVGVESLAEYLKLAARALSGDFDPATLGAQRARAMRRRYWLFGGYTRSPLGGAHDLIATSDDVDAIVRLADQASREFTGDGWWSYVFDQHSGETKEFPLAESTR